MSDWWDLRGFGRAKTEYPRPETAPHPEHGRSAAGEFRQSVNKRVCNLNDSFELFF
jgi:hypothetical protein